MKAFRQHGIKQAIAIKRISFILYFVVIITFLEAISLDTAEAAFTPRRLDGGKHWYVAYSPDNNWLATVHGDFRVGIWDIVREKFLVSLGGAGTVAFSPDSKLLAAGGSGITLWDIPGMSQRVKLGNSSSGSIAFSPDGKLLASATGSHDTIVELWDVVAEKKIADLIASTSTGVNAVAFSSDGKLLATGGWEIIKLWDITSKREVATLKGLSGYVYGLAFSPDGKILASFSNASDIIRLWDVTNKTGIAVLTGDGSDVSAIAFSPDGRLLASAAWNGVIRFWDIASKQELIAMSIDTTEIRSIAFSSDGRNLVSGHWTGLYLWQPNITDTPTPIAPANGAVIKDDSVPILAWTGVSNGLLYHVQASEDADFKALIADIITEKIGAPLKSTSKTTYWRVRSAAFGSYGNWSPVQSFTVIAPPAPTLATPKDKTDINDSLTPILKWQPVSDAKSYRLQVASDIQFTAVLMDQKLSGTEYRIPTGKLKIGTYYWRLASIGNIAQGEWSTAWSFRIQPPPPPKLSSPTNTTVFKDTITPILKWMSSQSDVVFKIQIATDEKFTNIVVEQADIITPEYQVLTGKLEGRKTYYWRVNARGVTGTSDWSQYWSFKVESPTPPELVAPLNNGIVDSTIPTLKWQAVVSISSYSLQIATDEKFTDVVEWQSAISKTEYQVSQNKVEDGKTYYWRVNATGVTGTSDWSPAWKFKVDAINLVMPEVTKATLEDVTVEIKVKKAKKLYGFKFDLTFDPTLLEVATVSEGDFLKKPGGTTLWRPPIIQPGIITAQGIRTTPGGVDGDGVITTIKFNVKKTGSSMLVLDKLSFLDENSNSLNVSTTEGKVTISANVSAKIKSLPRIENSQVVVDVIVEEVVNLKSYTVDLEHSPALELIEGITQIKGSSPGTAATIKFRIWESGKVMFRLKNGSMAGPLNVTGVPIMEDSAITVVASPRWDVNKDYVVDIFDLVFIGNNFNMSIKDKPRPNPDVVEDGVVDLFDIVAVGSHFGETYSALPKPATPPLGYNVDRISNLMDLWKTNNLSLEQQAVIRANLTVWQMLYSELIKHPNTEPEFTKTRQLIEQLIMLAGGKAVPKETRLRQNYPNPFNPETWIPFELSEGADVTIRIYNVQGQLVRILALGRKEAGYYIEKSKAAYWDGRNEAGEHVSSGLYFYELSTGGFRSIRKMMIIR